MKSAGTIIATNTLFTLLVLRPYQQSAIDAVYQYLRTKNGNPCVVLPTAAGKTPVLATICYDAVQRWGGRVLVLAHVKELLQQAADKLQAICPDVPVGVYSAGLRSRETKTPIIVAGIQSVYKKACELDRFDLIIVDEAHLIPPSSSNGKRPAGTIYCNGTEVPTARAATLPPEGEGMYQTFLKDAKIVNPRVRLIGLTATPYRMKSGTLIGKDHLLNEICYEISIKELIEQGFLCPLKSKSGRHKIDCSEFHLRGGEFIASEVDELMNTTDQVESACREIVAQTRQRHSVLIFGASVDHATKIKETLEKITRSECGLVTGETPSGERERLLRRFKGQRAVASHLVLPHHYNNPLPLVAGVDERSNAERIIEREASCDETTRFQLKFLANVNVLTTGFDAPNIDCVVLLRPTNSPGLYYQMVGRGFRLHETKTDCLVLDYGGNILRHGPVDAIQIKDKKTGGGGEPPVKECPKCLTIIPAAVMTCPDCGYEFPPPENNKLNANASNEGILTGEIIDTEYDVEKIYYSVHTKRGGGENDPQTLRINYQVGLNEFKSEWVCPEHNGWARKKFEKWWTERSNDPIPVTASFAVRIGKSGGIADVKSIVVRKVAGEKFDRIIRYALGEKPHAVSENFDDDYIQQPEDTNDPFDEGFLRTDEVPF
jgi:DNA repair protein RadD